MADAAEELDVVLLEAHAGAAPEAEPAPGQLGGDVVDRDGQSGGEPLDDHGERGAVGLAGGQVAQHRSSVPAGIAAPGEESGARDLSACRRRGAPRR